MRRQSLCILAVAMCAIVFGGAMQARATFVWDLEDDFSATTNPNGAWSYGNAATGVAFNTHETLSNGFICWHAGNGDPHVMQNPTGTTQTIYNITLEPGAVALGPYTGLAAVRWTAPATGSYDVSSLFTVAQSTGAYGPVAVYHNTTPLGTATLSASAESYSWGQSALALTAGDTLNFVVGDGAGMTRDIRLQATITSEVPEPSTLLLLCFGMVSLAAYAWRRRK